MAKAKYNPLQAIHNDPLAGLKAATTERVDAESSTIQEDSGSQDSNLGTSNNDPAPIQAPPPQAARPQLSSAPIKPLSPSLKPSRNTVYLYPEDLTKLRQLSGYASTEHGIRANDSMIVRAALSLIETDVRFLHALKDAVLSDRRRTPKHS
ncbi:hypothetical protein HDF16_005339 [Granulicella aggregans]|uniref:Uncharacterized protein n=1 Tax=Granulicella aggregans TaxID=474949 RepID=A0A7W8E5W9_9BACT|nr:hypothetical protein [Granulicella aggregans]